MKPTDLMGNGEVQLAGQAVLLNSLPGAEGTPRRTQTTARKTTNNSRVFPTKLLKASLAITGLLVFWALLVALKTIVPAPSTSAVVSTGLLLGTLGTWFATLRTLFQFRDGVQASVELVQKEKEQVARERDLMRIIIDDLPDCIYAKDAEGRFVLNNIAHAKHLGANSPSAMLGKTDFDFFPRELAAQFFADEKKIIETGTPVINQEQFKEVLGDNKREKRWSFTSKVLWRDPEGRVIGTAGVTRDIHESKMAIEALRKSEEKLRQSTIQLERSNRELQDFAYVASHDLQEPLRKIVVFGERLKEKCADGLSSEGQDYLGRMSKAAARMQVLISDLLAFSRITTKAQPFTTVELSRTANEVIRDLELRIEQTHAQVQVGSLPTIQAEHLQMRQLLQNIVGNALKFRHPEQSPIVRIEAKVVSAPRPRSAPGAQPEDLCVLSVSDNGIGFDEKYLDRIFNVFQRLHTRGEYEGTGMGLAIAKKIVLYHGGDITAQSKPGHGSTFIVTLPVSHSNNREEVHRE